MPAVELIFLQTPQFHQVVPGPAAAIFLQSEQLSSRNAAEMREFHARVHPSARPPFRFRPTWYAEAVWRGHMDAAVPMLIPL